MNDLRTAAQQALEACEQRLPLKGQAAIIDELNALRAALAQEQAEPARSQRLADAGFQPRDTRLTCDECGGKFTRQILPIHKCEQERAEPVAWAFRHSDGTYHDPSVTEHSAGMAPLYTAPPQRKPLTEEEIDRIHLHLSSTVGSSYKTVARAIEKASWEKNNGQA